METLSSPTFSGEDFSTGPVYSGGAGFDYGAMEGFSSPIVESSSLSSEPIPDYLPTSWINEDEAVSSSTSGVDPYLVEAINKIGSLVENEVEPDRDTNYDYLPAAVIETPIFTTGLEDSSASEVQAQPETTNTQEVIPSKTVLYSEILKPGESTLTSQNYFHELINYHGGEVGNGATLISPLSMVGEKALEVTQSSKTADGSVIDYRLVVDESGEDYVEVALTAAEEERVLGAEVLKPHLELEWVEADREYSLTWREGDSVKPVPRRVTEAVKSEFNASKWTVKERKDDVGIYSTEGAKRSDSEVMLGVEDAVDPDIPIYGSNVKLLSR